MALLTLVLLAACGDGFGSSEGGRQAMTVRDSAGITIVENSDSAWTEETRWSIASDPDLVIGSVDGSVPGTDFGWVRQAAALPSGGVAVLEGTVREIRVFDREGSWIGSHSGLGDGPTEFRLLADIGAIRGDSVAGFGSRSRKIVTFPMDGGDARGHSTPEQLHAGRHDWGMVGWRLDGSYLLRAANPRGASQGLGLDSTHFVLFSAAGDSLRSFGSFPLVMRVLDGETFGVVLPSGLALTRVGGDGFWHALPTSSFEVTFVDLSTGSRRIIRRRHDPIATPNGLLSEIAEQEINELRGTPVEDLARARWDISIELDDLPALVGLKVASDGTLWVQHPAHPDEVEPEERARGLTWPASSDWTVLDSDGRWLGTLQIAEGLTVQEIGPDWVLGVRENDLGVPFVERYRILKP